MRTMKPETREIYPELKKIENEIQILKILFMKYRKMPKKAVKLEGALKGVKIEEEDIEEAKKSIFKFSA
jgi:hypothetical protein